MTVDERVSDVVDALLRIENVHGGKCIVCGIDAYHFLGHLDRVAVFGVKACDERIGIALLHH